MLKLGYHLGLHLTGAHILTHCWVVIPLTVFEPTSQGILSRDQFGPWLDDEGLQRWAQYMHKYIRICIGICICVCMFICIFVYMYVCTYVHVYIYTHVCRYMHSHIRKDVCRYTCSLYGYICIYACICVCIFYVCRYVGAWWDSWASLRALGILTVEVPTFWLKPALGSTTRVAPGFL